MKVSVIYGEAQELEARLREWLSQHSRARIQGTTQSSVANGAGSVLVTVVIWYQE